jgi:hypothetical protein
MYVKKMKSPTLLKLIKSILIVTCLAVMSGCGPKASPLQRQQLAKLLESGSRLNSAVKASVTFKDFEKLYAEYASAIELVNSNWPESLSANTKKYMLKSGHYWNVAQKAWSVEKSIGAGGDIDFPVDLFNIPELLPAITTKIADSGANKGEKVAKLETIQQLGFKAGALSFELLTTDLNKILNN